MNIEFLTFIPAIFELLAIYLLSKKNKFGFLFNIIGSILWVIYSIYTGNAFGLILVCSIAISININGFKKWSKGN